MTDTDSVKLVERMSDLLVSIGAKTSEVVRAAEEEHDLWTAKALSDMRDDLRELREIAATLHSRLNLSRYQEQFNKTLSSIFPNPGFHPYK